MTIPLIIEANLRSSLLCAVLWLAIKALKLRNPHVEKMACTLALIASLAMPILMHGLKIVIPPGGLVTVPAMIPNPSAPFTPPGSVVLAGPSVVSGSSAEGFAWWLGLSEFYFVVACLLLFRLAVGLALTWRLCSVARPLPELGPRVRVSSALHAPVTFGSTVLLPAESTNWPALKLQAALIHENAHAQNLDFYVLLLASVNCSLFWFNPIAWWLKSHLSDLAETTSDIATIKGLDGDRVLYAEILLEMARHPSHFAGVAMAHPAKIVSRIECILGETNLPRRLGWRGGLALMTGILPLILLTAGGTPISVKAAGTSTVIKGNNDTYARLVAPFNKVVVSGPWKLNLTVGQAQSVAVAAPPNVLAHIVTKVRNETLYVYLDRSRGVSFDGNARLGVHVSVPHLSDLQAHGNGIASVSGFSGGESTFAIHGSWKVTASGHLNMLSLHINGSSEASFEELATNDVSLFVNGRSQVHVWAERKLNVNIHGRGVVRYSGSPTISQMIHGHGSLASM